MKDRVRQVKSTSRYRDPLTGLASRELFYDRLSQAIKFSSRNNKPVAALFISFDRLKLINDTLGERAGNQLLKAIAGRLRSCVRKSDTVARPGRDEFTILLPEIRYEEDAALIARKILASFESPFTIKKHQLFISSNIGISIHPNDGDDAKELLKTSYAALLRAREEGKNTFQFHAPSLTLKAFERMLLENSLRLALLRQEFILHYQPQVDLRTGEITGVEALVRWQKPDAGLVYPGIFLPLMEETGLIIPLGEWALLTACKQNMEWQKAGLKPIRVAVNISASHFYKHDLTHLVSMILEDTGLDPQFLEIELTETIFMHNLERTVKALMVMRNMGINISIDDFGTGYASMGYLKYFPMSKLKIVEPFISTVSFSGSDEVIARTIIAMAHTLNMKVIAEGIEKKEHLTLLRSLDCDEFQGNIFSRPLPASRITKLLAKQQ